MMNFIYSVPGIADEYFIRGKTPMTKAEVRAVTLSRLQPRKGQTVVDIGAGTGSVSIECAFIAGRIVAVEKDDDAVNLIAENARRFGRDNVTVVYGHAPEALGDDTRADRIFIGGSQGSLPAILHWAHHALPSGGRVAANFITLENAVLFVRWLRESRYIDIDVTQLSVSKGRFLGESTLMQAHNPVYILSGEKP